MSLAACECGEVSCRANLIASRKTVERLDCYERTIARLRAQLAVGEKLFSICLERGQTPSLSNQVRLDEMCREMALRAKEAT